MTNFSTVLTELKMQREKFDVAINALTALESETNNGYEHRIIKRRAMSAASKRLISEKMKQRWAERKRIKARSKN